MAQKNLLLHLGKSSFGAQDGDGIQLEDTLHGKIIVRSPNFVRSKVTLGHEDTA